MSMDENVVLIQSTYIKKTNWWIETMLKFIELQYGIQSDKSRLK